MNNETHEDRVKILAGAPDGAVMFTQAYCFYYYEDNLNRHLGLIENNKAPKEVVKRSLADIQKLVDMQNEINELKCRVVTLEGAATQTIGWVESTNGCIESIRMLLNVMDKD